MKRLARLRDLRLGTEVDVCGKVEEVHRDRDDYRTVLGGGRPRKVLLDDGSGKVWLNLKSEIEVPTEIGHYILVRNGHVISEKGELHLDLGQSGVIQVLDGPPSNKLLQGVKWGASNFIAPALSSVLASIITAWLVVHGLILAGGASEATPGNSSSGSPIGVVPGLLVVVFLWTVVVVVTVIFVRRSRRKRSMG